MSVNSARGFNRAVTEPFLQVLKIAAVVHIICSKRMAEIMETYMRQTVVFEYSCELMRDKIGADKPAVRMTGRNGCRYLRKSLRISPVPF